MAQFTVNAQRFDPYKNFKFRVRWDGRYVLGVNKVGMLKRTTMVLKATRPKLFGHRVQREKARRRRGTAASHSPIRTRMPRKALSRITGSWARMKSDIRSYLRPSA